MRCLFAHCPSLIRLIKILFPRVEHAVEKAFDGVIVVKSIYISFVRGFTLAFTMHHLIISASRNY